MRCNSFFEGIVGEIVEKWNRNIQKRQTYDDVDYDTDGAQSDQGIVGVKVALNCLSIKVVLKIILFDFVEYEYPSKLKVVAYHIKLERWPNNIECTDSVGLQGYVEQRWVLHQLQVSYKNKHKPARTIRLQKQVENETNYQ